MLMIINFQYFYDLLKVINIGMMGVLVVIGNMVVVVGFGVIVKLILVFQFMVEVMIYIFGNEFIGVVIVVSVIVGLIGLVLGGQVIVLLLIGQYYIDCGVEFE